MVLSISGLRQSKSISGRSLLYLFQWLQKSGWSHGQVSIALISINPAMKITPYWCKNFSTSMSLGGARLGMALSEIPLKPHSNVARNS